MLTLLCGHRWRRHWRRRRRRRRRNIWDGLA
jgi:hypothetical protein